jgi:UDP:flavonoid glycosyltransferase YjiC (YdhE family)
VDELTTDRLRGLIEKVLQDPSYRDRADYFQNVISKTRGLDVAADVIEQVFQKHQTLDSRSVARGKHKTAEEMQEA